MLYESRSLGVHLLADLAERVRLAMIDEERRREGQKEERRRKGAALAEETQVTYMPRKPKNQYSSCVHVIYSNLNITVKAYGC
jgi:hypothetical protein